MTGPITHWLVKARNATESDQARAYIDRAIYLIRRLHHRGS